MYHEIGHEMDVAQAEAMIAQVDVDGDKQINLQEFNQLMLNFKQERALDQDDQLDRFRAMFCDADTDYSGYLSVDEIYSVMLKQGIELTNEELIELIFEFDVSGDGLIDIDEFVEMMDKSSKIMVNSRKAINVQPKSAPIEVEKLAP